ncbi:MAG: hypothetical protein JXL97_16330, partial [Bacteroidales bacterium]|nr:hypothetical protein [Bacteroidales bacterium]
MKYKTIDFIYKWLVINNFRKTSLSNIVKDDFVGSNILGYVYIDKTAGITLDVLYLFDSRENEINITESFLERKIRCV